MKNSTIAKKFPISNWEFNTLGIINYRKPSKFDLYFKFIRENHSTLPGDIIESGVYNGSSLLATAMLLKELGSEKLVYGFDTFSGFPPGIDKNDEFKMFELMYSEGEINTEHYNRALKAFEYRNLMLGSNPSPRNISTSGDFSSVNIDMLRKKISFFGLDNIRLIPGSFEETMKSNDISSKFMCSMIDCDLYRSYLLSLNFIFPRLVIGGFCYLDEYFSLKFPGARLAVNKFLKDKPHKMLCLNQHDNDDFERWGFIKNA